MRQNFIKNRLVTFSAPVFFGMIFFLETPTLATANPSYTHLARQDISISRGNHPKNNYSSTNSTSSVNKSTHHSSTNRSLISRLATILSHSAISVDNRQNSFISSLSTPSCFTEQARTYVIEPQ